MILRHMTDIKIDFMTNCHHVPWMENGFYLTVYLAILNNDRYGFSRTHIRVKITFILVILGFVSKVK